MADNTSLTPPPVTPEENNKKVAEDLLKQGLETLSKPEDTAAAGDALDALAKTVVEKKTADADATSPADATPPPADPTPEQKAAAEAAKVAADAAKASTEAADKIFKDSPALPTNASPKSSEAFTAIKIKAVQEISQRDSEIEKLKKENADLQEKAKSPATPEMLKELEDHRNWRLKLDVDADPKFKQFDQTVAQAHDFIYSQLKKSPVITDDIIAKIKEHGGPEKVNLTKVFEAIKDPTIQRLVEAKVADIELVHYNKEQAIKSAKENIGTYVAERTKHAQAMVNQHNTATKAQVDHLVGQLEWLKPKPVDEKADAATKAANQDYNKFVTETQQQLAAAMQDDSAEMRAILLVGMAQLFNIQREHAARGKELETVKKELAEVTDKWNKVKTASTSRLRESAAPANGLPPAKPKTDVNTHTGDALDAIAKQVMEKRAAATA